MICASAVVWSSQMPIWRAISIAVADVSPVTIFTCIPALTHWPTAPGTSGRIGSLMAVTAWKVSFLPPASALMSGCSPSASVRQAKASVRMAWFW